MKINFVVLMSAAILVAGCSSKHQAKQLENDVMQKISDGAYLLSQVTITENGETTVKQRDQIKIYSKGKFMFALDN